MTSKGESRKSDVSISYLIDGVAMPRFERKRVVQIVSAALASADSRTTRLPHLQAVHLTVLFISDERAADLHGLHFNDATTTDVMTFPDGSCDPTGILQIGDLAVCVSVARREALSRKRPFADELTLYILHGFLHLLGYDDRTQRSLKAMWAEQRRLLAQVGIPLEAKPG